MIVEQVTEPKIGPSVVDLLGGLRQWRRLLGRAAELRLALPDPVVLSSVMVGPRICALRVPGLGPTPWNAPEFNQMP